MSEPVRERGLIFGRHKSLVGLITEPKVIRGRPVVILGAGILHRIGPSRVSVDLARALAAAGHPVLRFDLSGIGESARAVGASLIEQVITDITDAIDLAMTTAHGTPWADGVALVGYCSGADNAFFVGADDARVKAMALFDPTIHETEGFRSRLLRRRLTSLRSWWNIVSGRSLWLRLRSRVQTGQYQKPPDYYGLLVATPDDAIQRASRIAARRVPALFILTSGCANYCNAPEQVRESLREGFSPDLFRVTWAPQVDHVLSEVRQVTWFTSAINEWLGASGQRESVR
jgi:dienelactone hydrolase